MSDLAPEIQMPQVLEPLLYATRCVSIKLSGPCLPKVATALKSSSLCRLEVVDLSDSGQWQALAKIVSGHSTLECLTIQLDDESMTSSVHTINAINALKENTALKSLNLDNGSVFANIVEPSKAMLRAILSLVTENPTIEDIQFSADQFAFGRNSFLEKKTFLLKWNGVGRNLWQNSAKSELPWIDALSNASHDVRALFHLLSKNPALCGSSPQLKSLFGRKRSREPTFGDHGPNVRPCIRSVGDLSWSPFHEVIDFRFFDLS
ncbi:expressed unknown protein [Seminavis robusta]|uniref:Uncharacterized protein n=1 Tax=Seminavis robusta TaxID=568900 RepID=A0A9N8EYA1_9STRA|nr:expressed unknown protein [Seminavis robusta]|eukprot:Sro2381_g325540.1 n/a (263) ;mRNA; r:12711-13499